MFIFRFYHFIGRFPLERDIAWTTHLFARHGFHNFYLLSESK